MSDQLPVPPEFEHLIEKRKSGNRRETDRRGDGNRRSSDQGPIGCLESDADLEQLPVSDRRSDGERRENGDRRIEARREIDEDPAAAETAEESSPQAG